MVRSSLLVCARNGVAHVVWRESLGGGDWQIFYADDRGGAWSTPAQITFDTTVKGSPVIAVGDSSGIVHIAYATAEPTLANNEIWYLEYDTIGDTVESLRLTKNTVNDNDATIGVTAGGTVSIAWVGGGFSGAIRCMEGTIGGFTEVPTGVTVSAAQPDLELDEDGRQHIAYRATVGSNRVIRYVRRDGGGFTTPLDASASDAFYTQPSLLVAAGGFPSVAYVTNTAGSKGLYVAQWDLDQFNLPDTVHADAAVTYNETDFEQDPFRVGLPSGLMTSVTAFLAVSVGYVEADTVRADLRVFQGPVIAVGVPDVATPANGLVLTTAPNPFVNGTTVRFTLPEASGNVQLDVHDVTGRRIARLLDAPRTAGIHDVRWSPGALPAGVYWLQLTADGGAKTTAVQRIR